MRELCRDGENIVREEWLVLVPPPWFTTVSKTEETPIHHFPHQLAAKLQDFIGICNVFIFLYDTRIDGGCEFRESLSSVFGVFGEEEEPQRGALRDTSA